jgi:hypothetical protein
MVPKEEFDSNTETTKKVYSWSNILSENKTNYAKLVQKPRIM